MGPIPDRQKLVTECWIAALNNLSIRVEAMLIATDMRTAHKGKDRRGARPDEGQELIHADATWFKQTFAPFGETRPLQYSFGTLSYCA